ncbi:MAG: CapA family protein [Nitrososphaeraceae archaeon]|nr:CapA family protein [Nitrososphaeraceae archaeon]
MQILFVGDVMLGRLVNNVLPKENFKYVWGNTIEIIQKADFSLLNLECAISSKGKEWKKTFKVFHFRAHPNAIKVLKSASIDYVALANNHILDYDVEGLVDTIDLLDKYNISHSGAGKDLKNATKPAFIEKKIKINQDKHKKLNVKKYENIKDSIRIGLISLTDNQPEWEAYPNSPGVNYIPLTLQQNIYSDRLENSILEAKKQSDLVIVASHVGPHFREMPSNTYVNFAHKIIDFGADIYWGHSNHTPKV